MNRVGHKLRREMPYPNQHLWNVLRVFALLLFVGSAAFILKYNVSQMMEHPDVGINYVLFRRTELAREVEGTDRLGKEELISLTLGDAMRLVLFISRSLPDDALVVFPEVEPGDELGNRIFRYAGWDHFVPYLYPRQFQQSAYDYQDLPFDLASAHAAPQALQLLERDYVHSSQHWVFLVFASPESKEYRLYYKTTYPVKGNMLYHTENLFVVYPQDSSS